jgi:ABC-type bacteriocin/lantibiotic exporter with double-glycine peptidase domain
MSDLISLPHYQQSAEGYCLPACARMVLAYLGLELTEAEVSQTLGAQEFGTPSFAVQQLTALNVQVTYREWSVAQLLDALRAKAPVLVFVRTAFLDHWTNDVAHAVVIVGATENQQFWIHDPAWPAGPQAVSWDGLLAAWAEFSYRGAVITK